MAIKIYKQNMNKNFLTIIIAFIMIVSCSKNKESENSVFKKKSVPINATERAGKAIEKGGGLQESLFGKKNAVTTYDFATSNSMWRASIELLKEIPLANVDYSGGVIVTDWYSKDGKESVKINITFSSNELNISSFNVVSFKKLCTSLNDCKIEKMENDFSSTIKNKIISKAREIEIARANAEEKGKN